jgi:hypothetical protein
MAARRLRIHSHKPRKSEGMQFRCVAAFTPPCRTSDEPSHHSQPGGFEERQISVRQVETFSRSPKERVMKVPSHGSRVALKVDSELSVAEKFDVKMDLPGIQQQ